MRGGASRATLAQVISMSAAPARICLVTVDDIAWLVLPISWAGPEIILNKIRDPIAPIVRRYMARWIASCIRLHHHDIAIPEAELGKFVYLDCMKADSLQRWAVKPPLWWIGLHHRATGFKRFAHTDAAFAVSPVFCRV